MASQSVKPGPGLSRPLSCLDPASASANRGPLSRNVVGPDGKPYRWEWDTPILFSSVTPGVAYTAANVLFRSTDRGGSWKAISPDLTAKINRDTIFIRKIQDEPPLWTLRDIQPGQRVNTFNMNLLVTTLDQLQIMGVRPKPPALR